MSLMKKKYTNSSGTISKTFKIGKNRLTIDNEVDGSLRFSLYDSQGVLTEWKLNSDDKSIEFPTGDKIIASQLLERLDLIEQRLTAIENIEE
jgi:hypothetical protein